MPRQEVNSFDMQKPIQCHERRAKHSRIARLVQMIGLLQTGGGQSADSLSRACGVSRRTVFRDLDILRRASVPLVFNESDQRYGIPNTYFLPPTSFTTEEALAILVLSRQLACDDAMPFPDAAIKAAVKLEGSLPQALQQKVRDLSRALMIETPAVNRLSGHTDVYRQLLAAIVHRHAVTMCYDSLAEQAMLRTKLDPYQLLFRQRSWCVIGRSSHHREVRTFNVGRIRELHIRDETFDIPRSFSLCRYLRNAWSVNPDPGPSWHVWIRFRSLVAQSVAELAWHPTQRCEFCPDGQLDFRVTVSDLNSISWWILGYGDQAEVFEPLELRRLLAERAEQMAKTYRQLENDSIVAPAKGGSS